MKHRDRVLLALNHQETDRPPFQATFVPEFAAKLRDLNGACRMAFSDKATKCLRDSQSE